MTDRRVLRTRNALRDSLMELIAEKDFDAITVTEIADRANIARATFYLHYDDKFDLLWRSMEEVFDKLDMQLGQIDTETLLIQGKPLTHAVFAHVAQNADFYRAMMPNAPFADRLHEYLATASERHHAPLRRTAKQVTIDPAFTANFLAGAVIGLMRWWLVQPEPPSPDHMAEYFTALAAPGIMASLK